MKIERINENQIRCILTKNDLAQRAIKISELTYGSEKAKTLFRDMMRQAQKEFGFNAEDIPLMIEAIPVSSECLVLMITKVDDPDELDTRFSKFSSDDDTFTTEDDEEAYADEIINSFGELNDLLDDTEDDFFDDNFIPLSETLSSNNISTSAVTSNSVSIQPSLMKLYTFHTLDELIALASHISPRYSGINTLFKDKNGLYYLLLNKGNDSPENFNKICNMISEFGTIQRTTYASSSFFQEHCKMIINENALQTLAKI